tara:strand:+ start:393 stop:704 length:312 start_codon:yes stop_codon:yes gene_type:complete
MGNPIDEEHIYTTQACMQNFATQIMRYLTAHGSHIKTFGIQPSTVEHVRLKSDANQHRWPRYFYVRGCSQDRRGFKECIAIPITKFELQHGTVFQHAFCRWVV